MPNTRYDMHRICRGFPQRAQEGLVLFIALIVLVAMTLAGVSLMRAVDTGLVVAGNMAFKQSAIMVADRGTQVAAAWLNDAAVRPTLQSTQAAQGYTSALPASEPDWFKEDSWLRSVAVDGGAADAAGNRVRYVIHRMCTLENAAHDAAGNDCSKFFDTSPATSGGSMRVGASQFLGTPKLYYRVTTRVDGPRNTVSVIQTSIIVGI